MKYLTNHSMCAGVLLAWATMMGFAAADQSAPVLEAVTFAVEPRQVYVPLDQAATALGWQLQRAQKSDQIRLENVPIPPGSLRKLLNGTEWIQVGALTTAGAHITRKESAPVFNVGTSRRYFTVAVGAKRAEVNLAQQKLRAWQGNRLVLESRVSSGRRGSTPLGRFRAGPYKARRHYSSRYENAPMPWSVQVTGHIFIHGFTSVPKYPASHGCIRLPLNEGNPAKFFYEWIDKGTPIRIVRR